MTGVNDGCQMMRGRCGSIGKREREEGQGKERNLQVRASPSIEKKAHNFRMSPVLVAPLYHETVGSTLSCIIASGD